MIVHKEETARTTDGFGPLMKSPEGFTLVEILIAIAVFVVVMTMVMSVFISGLRSQAEGAANLALEREGSMILERIVRGVYGEQGLREANVGSVLVGPDGNVIRFTVDRNATPTTTKDDDTTSLIYLLNGEIYYRADASSVDFERISGPEGTVESLQFAKSSSGVEITLKLTSSLPVTDRQAFIHLTKSVTLRN